MFCPRLDSALVASIYHDLGDFKACIPLLSELAAAATSATTSRSESSSPNQTPTESARPSSSPGKARANPKYTSRSTTTIGSTTTGSTSTRASANEKNILIWSEEVANSNPSSRRSTPVGNSRSGGQTQSTLSTKTTNGVPSSPTSVAPSTGVGQRTHFRAVRNPLYLKKHGIAVDDTPSTAETNGSENEGGGNSTSETEEGLGDKELEEEEDDDKEPTFTRQQHQPSHRHQENRSRTSHSKRQQKPKSLRSADPMRDTQPPSSSTETPRRTWKREQTPQQPVLEEQLGVLDLSEEFEKTAIEKPAVTDHVGGNTIREEELEFLRSCFPDRDMSEEYMESVLRESGQDLEQAVDRILSQMFLENEQIETSSAGSGSLHSGSTTTSSNTTSSLDDLFFQGISKDKKKSAGPWKSQDDGLLRTLEYQDEFLIPESNHWATFEHQISILMNIFHTLPQKTIVSEYHANGTNLFKTVESLEERLKKENQDGTGLHRQSQFDIHLAQLVEMFPDHSTEGLKKMLVFNGGNFTEAMNAVLAADIARAEVGDLPTSSKKSNVISLQPDIRFVDQTFSGRGPTANQQRLRSMPSTSNPFPGGQKPFPNTLLDQSNFELYNDEDDPVWCRQRAQEVLNQRNELFRKAAKAYKETKGKGVGMGGIAAFYADEGKKLDVQGKQWHMRAARAVVQQNRLENKDPNLVDLHGLTTSEAQTVVKEAVTEWFSRSTMQAARVTPKPLRIICGIGSHSKDRIARLYPTILRLLTKDGWNCEAENGVILVKGVSRIMPSSSGSRR